MVAISLQCLISCSVQVKLPSCALPKTISLGEYWRKIKDKAQLSGRYLNSTVHLCCLWTITFYAFIFYKKKCGSTVLSFRPIPPADRVLDCQNLFFFTKGNLDKLLLAKLVWINLFDVYPVIFRPNCFVCVNLMIETSGAKSVNCWRHTESKGHWLWYNMMTKELKIFTGKGNWIAFFPSKT